MIEKLIAMAPDIQAGNASRGFWDDKETKSKGEAVMLMITELSEAVEADRKGDVLNPVSRLKRRDEPRNTGWAFDVVDSNLDAWLNWFNAEVKNTTQDEIADTVIRILDYCHGFGYAIIERDFKEKSNGNFASDVLRISSYCINALHNDRLFAAIEGFLHSTYGSKDWGYVLAAIIKFCEWYDIDLLQHIEWKLKYNSTRPRLHGKKY